MIILLLGLVAGVAMEPVYIGDINTLHHLAGGELWSQDNRTLRIINFNYDGAGPDAFFVVGTEGTPNSFDESTAAILAYPFQGWHYQYRDSDAPVLGSYTNENVSLVLPPSMKVSDLRWLSIWCRKFGVDFGSIQFNGGQVTTTSAPEEPEKSVKIGNITPLRSEFSGGSLSAIDDQTLRVTNFYYRPNKYSSIEPKAYFLVSTVGNPWAMRHPKTAILAHPYKGIHYSFEDNDAPILTRAEREEVTLSLPPDMKVTDLRWLSVYDRNAEEPLGVISFSFV